MWVTCLPLQWGFFIEKSLGIVNWLWSDTSPNWSDAISVPSLPTSGKIHKSGLNTRETASLCDWTISEDIPGIHIIFLSLSPAQVPRFSSIIRSMEEKWVNLSLSKCVNFFFFQQCLLHYWYCFSCMCLRECKAENARVGANRAICVNTITLGLENCLEIEGENESRVIDFCLGRGWSLWEWNMVLASALINASIMPRGRDPIRQKEGVCTEKDAFHCICFLLQHSGKSLESSSRNWGKVLQFGVK